MVCSTIYCVKSRNSINVANIADKSRRQLQKGIDVLEKSQNTALIYAQKSPEEKRKLLKALFTTLHLDGSKLLVDYNPYALAISKRVKKHHNLIKNFRTNENTPDNGGEMSLEDSLRTVWRARPDSALRAFPLSHARSKLLRVASLHRTNSSSGSIHVSKLTGRKQKTILADGI